MEEVKMIAEKRYKIELEAVEPLRIGAVEDPRSGIHNPVAKVGEKVVIPGSSLKGALRAEIEQFLIETYYDKGSQSWAREKEAFQPCVPTTKPSNDEQALINLRKYRPEACHYPCGIEERIQKGEKVIRGKCTREGKATPHSICPACYFLGATGLPGFVRVPFLYAELPPEELYSARIDRGTGTVVEGTNRDYQLVPANAKFTGNLVVVLEDPVSGWEVGNPRPLGDKTLGDKWLEGKDFGVEDLIDAYIIKRLENIKILGGYKSKGFGAVKIKVTPL
jgi:CRISPR/Cas system CSM-associated protein Csm3 (group 7 of RAMP superfamily)